MGLKPREPTDGSGGGQNVVSSVTAEEMQAMAAEYADGYPSDEDMYEEATGEARKGKPNLATKLSSAVKNFSLPSPDDIMNSSFVKSFQQPLMVKSKVQSPKTLATYQATIAENSPATLSKINKLSDFPMPSIKKREKEETAKEECNGDVEPHEDFGYGTLRSLKETKLITKVVETDINDEQTLKNMELTKTMSPSQLAEIKSFKDFPLPNVQMFKKSTQPKAVNGHAGDATDGGEDEEKKAFGESFMNTKLMTNSKESDPDDAKIIARQELVKTKSPAQLASITSLSDFPVPAKIENLLKGSGGNATSVDFSMSSLKDGHFTVPDSLKMELQTNATVEDEEIMTKNRELVNTKSVAQLSQIHSLAEFPIPEVIENLINKKQTPGQESDSMIMTKSNLSLANLTSSNILPASLRETKLITNVKEEKDHEKLLARQNLIKSKTPMELSQIKDWGEFPIPAKFQNLQIPTLKRSMPDTEAVVDSPTAPPRQKSCNNSIYESLPNSLRNEVIVRSRPITDEELKIRQEIIRSKSPTELSQISSLKDIPVPKRIEKLFEKGEAGEGKEKEGDYDFIEKYSTMPSSLKANLLVGAKVQDQALVQERQEVVKSKSVSELSEIKSFSDLPVPATLQRMAKKDRGEYAPVERKKLFKMQMKSQSSQSINQQQQPGTLPRSLKEQHLLMVKSKIEAPDVLASRRSLVETKSVAELSKVTSLADVPVPTFLSRLASASLNRLHSLSTGHLNESSAVDGGSMGRPTSGIYSALPSLNTELLVGKSVQDLSKVEERRQVVNSKSVSELSQVKSLKEFPVPDAVQRFCAKSMERLNGTAPTAGGDSGDGDASFFHIPSMLTQPCIVTTKVEDPQKLLEHQQIQQQKSVHELSKIRNLNELPVPGNLFQLPDVPLPKAKDLLKLVARPPRKAKTLPSPSLSERQPDSQLDNISNFESCSQIEEEATYSHLEDSYEIIEKEEVYVDSYQTEEAADEFGLASQVKGTPERNTRSNKKKKPDPRNRRSHEDREEAVSPTVETPPPLPPKRSPHKQMSVESVEEGSNLPSPTPVKGVLTLEAMNGNVQVNQTHNAPEIQARPLPTPPAPVRYNRTKHSMERQLQAQQQQQGVVKSSTTSSMDRTLIVDESVNFQTCRDTMMTTQSRTLIVSDDDNTMADSIVESLVSCTDTLICDDDATDENDDDPYPSVNFESGMSEILDDAIMQPHQAGERRLEEGTAQLSEELMNHVESLRNTLDNMSNRLGARSRSRSSSKPRSGSRPRPSSILQDKLHE